MIDRTESETEQHLEKSWENSQEDKTPGSLHELVEKSNGERSTGTRKPSYKRIAEEKFSLTGPDAASTRVQVGGSAEMGYRDHYIVDGGKSRIILSAQVSPTSIMGNTPLLDMLDWTCSCWELKPKVAVGVPGMAPSQILLGWKIGGLKLISNP